MKLLFLYLLAISNLISIVHLGLYTVGANSYDIVKFKKDRQERAKNKTRRKNRRPYHPLVSVIIPAHNESKVIKRTLDSVMISTYPNIEIVVIDDGSVDGTYKAVKDYIKKLNKRPTMRIRSYFTTEGLFNSRKKRFITIPKNKYKIKVIKQKNQGKAAALNNAIQNHTKGRYVMCLDADSLLQPQSVEKTVGYFKNNKVIGVAANVRIIAGRTLLSKIQQFEHMIGYRSKKFYSLANCEFIIGGVASTYRRSVLNKVKFYDNDTLTEDIGLSLKIVAKMGNKDKRIVYAPDVVALTEGVQSFKDLLRQRYRWKMGNLQNLFKYRSLIGSVESSRYSRALTLYRLPMALTSEALLLIEPILLGYVIYLSIMYHTFGILIGAYITITFYTMTVLWPDEHLKVKDKLKMSFSALWIYILFYVMDIVQVYAMIKSLRMFRTIINPKSGLSTWISPKRAHQIYS